MKSNSHRALVLFSLLVLIISTATGLSGCGGGGGGGSSGSPLQAPLITTQPSDQTVVNGQPATFSVSASGDAPITYQWRRGGVNIDGATAASFTLVLPQLLDSGSVWSVVVSNAAGSTTSAGASLIVKTGPGISLVAGMPGGGGSIDGAAGRFNGPSAVAVDVLGNVYVTEYFNQTIRKITPAGVVSTLAGSAGIVGATNGNAAAASFYRPTGIALDKAGNIYVADSGNRLIRLITPLGVVTTLASFGDVSGIATDGGGNVFVADGRSVRKIASAGQVSTFWIAPISTVGGFITALTADPGGTVYALDPEGRIFKITSDGVATLLIGSGGSCNTVSFLNATGITLDADGNLYIADTPHNTIVKITPSCSVTTIAGSATDPAGSNDGTGSAAHFSTPQSVALDGAGNILVADKGNNTIRKIAVDGKVTTLAGVLPNPGVINGLGTVARFNNAGFYPFAVPTFVANSGNYPPSGVASAGGVAIDGAGNIYVADTGNSVIRKITANGTVSTLAGIAGVSGALDGAAATATFAIPSGVTVDAAGNVYVADTGNHKIRKISVAGIVTTIAGADWERPITNLSGRIIISTGSLPVAVAVDGTGNIYVADRGVRVIRKIATSGVETKFDFGISSPVPRALTVDGQGNVYATASCKIVKITADGTINELVGVEGVCGTSDGVGAAARFQDPCGLTLDSAGNLYVADTGNHTIRKVTPAGVVTTLAGRTGVSGLVFGSLPGTLNLPVGLAIDANGLLYTTSENAVLRIQLL